ncbi:MAG TPA: carboxypeptidase regulatory-like domain-containing protein [Candidatus Cloacimonetes bacterium]|nr:carboxypeptidase regulatory-like domain-containing protein [Candidatus Cloacimonadota bacterium]
MKKILILLILVTVLFLLSCDKTPFLAPYSYNAILKGIIQFEDGSPDTLTATVQAYKTGVSTLQGEATTDTAGAFEIKNLSEGTYQLNVSAPNYDDFSLTNIQVSAFSTTTIDTVTLEVIKRIVVKVITIDGTIDPDWNSVYENTHVSNWGPSNEFHNLYLARSDDSLYIAVDGGFDGSGNTVNIYIDKDYGDGTGINDFSTITGAGYGDHLRKTVTAPENFGADLAYSGWALNYEVAVVSLEDPYAVDQHILDANTAVNSSVVEMAIPFSEMYDNGEVPIGSKIALVAIIGGGGDQYVADDTIPQQDDPMTFTTVFSRQY